MSMKHEEAQEQFSDYWDAGPEQKTGLLAQVEEHLKGCPDCRAEYERFTQAMAPLGKLHRMPAPDMIGTVPALIHKQG